MSLSDIGRSAEVLLSQVWKAEKTFTKNANSRRAAQQRAQQRRADIALLLAKALLGRYPYPVSHLHYSILAAWRNDWSKKQRFKAKNFSYDNRVLSERFAKRALQWKQPQTAMQTRRIATLNRNIFRSSFQPYGENPYFFRGLRMLSVLQGFALLQIGIALILCSLASMFLIRAEQVAVKPQRVTKSIIIGTFLGVLCYGILYYCTYTRRLPGDGLHPKTIVSCIVSFVGVLTIPFLTILLHHIFVAVRANCTSSSRSRLSFIEEYERRAPLRKLYDFAVFATLSQLMVFIVFLFFHLAAGRTVVILPVVAYSVGIELESTLWCLGLAIFALFLHCLRAWRFPSNASHKTNYHAVLRSFRAACSILIATSTVIYFVSLLASLPARHNIARQIDQCITHDNLWMQTGQDSAQWIAKLRP